MSAAWAGVVPLSSEWGLTKLCIIALNERKTLAPSRLRKLPKTMILLFISLLYLSIALLLCLTPNFLYFIGMPKISFVTCPNNMLNAVPYVGHPSQTKVISFLSFFGLCFSETYFARICV